MSGAATIPFRKLAASSASADLAIAGGRATLPGELGRLDTVDGRADAEWRENRGEVQIEQFVARSGEAQLSVQKTSARIEGKRWEISGLSGQIDTVTPGPSTQPAAIAKCYLLAGAIGLSGDASGDPDLGTSYSLTAQPRDVSLLMPGFSKPIESLSGTVNVSPGKIEFQEMQGNLLGGTVNASGTIVTPGPRHMRRLSKPPTSTWKG